ncbi:MAG: hypothetical protein ACF8GE_03655 [Phycisphaerales bacterium JB043]
MRLALTLAALVSTSSATAQLHEADVIPFIEDSTIKTGSIDSSGGSPVIVADRIFATPMQIFPIGGGASVAFAEDPGFNSAVGTFAPFSVFEIDILDALRVWKDGNFDSIAMLTPPAGPDVVLQVELSFGAATALSPTTPDTFVEGLDFVVTSLGDIHVHPEHAFDGSADPGVYMITLQIENQTGGNASSEPFFVLYDLNAAPSDLSDAITWVEDNLLNNCPGDLNDDGFTNGSDLGLFLGNWGNPGATDLNNDGTTDGSDLGLFLGEWGACP